MAKRIISFEKKEEKLPACFNKLAREIRSYQAPRKMPESEAKNRLDLLFPRPFKATASC